MATHEGPRQGRGETMAELMQRFAGAGWRLVNVVQDVDYSSRGRGLLFFFERERQ